jgi:DNA polymerase-3 subunit gamma/tau
MSDNYIVSARKYRPQTFDTVVGQEHITTTLKNAIKNQHLAHAFLFCGPRGVGKTTCARILAKTINCENPTADMEACGVCPTCVSFMNNSSFNVFELDAASNNSVDDIRELTSQVRFSPQQGKYKIYIIDEVHMLSGAAFNAFLKTLEEPPPYAIFILATTEKHKILPTVQSRCQIFEFKRITTHDIVAHLQSIAAKESMIAEEAALHIIARKSEGCMRDALSMLDRIASFTNGMLTYSNTMEHLNLLDANYYFRLTDNMLSQDVAGTLLLLDQALEKGFEGDIITNGLAEHFRNLLLCKDARMAKMLDVPNDHKQMYHEKANQVPPSFILSALNVLNDSELQYKNASNKRLHVEMCLIRLCYLLQAVSASQLAPVSAEPFDNGTVKKNISRVSDQVNEPSPTYLKNNVNNISQSFNNEHVILKEPHRPVSAPTPTSQSISTDNTVVASAPPPSNNRRLSMNMLSDIDAAVSKATVNTNEKKTLSVETAERLFEQYKQKLQSAGKNVLHAQFGMMRLEVRPPDEVRIISPSELTDTYAKEQRNLLIDFYRAETQMLVRITTEMQEDEEMKNELNSKVLSKTEMYDAMASKNPMLAKLRDGLGMQIEY